MAQKGPGTREVPISQVLGCLGSYSATGTVRQALATS